MSWRVYGAYETEEDAVKEIDFLTCCGYDKGHIEVVGKNQFHMEVGSVEELYAWEQAKDGFTYRKWKEENLDSNQDVSGLDSYEREFSAGYYLVLIKENKMAGSSVFADLPVPKIRQAAYL